MKKSHLVLAMLASIAIVGAIGDKVLLQPLPPPPPPQSEPPSPNLKPNAQSPLPSAKPALPNTLPNQLPNTADLLDAASKLAIEKYQNASCEELSQMKPKSDKNSAANSSPEAIAQAKAVEFLRNNPEIRKEFINRVAPPIANKMFECNIIP
ncbi:MAG: hypothetical protein MUE44_24055 [Oscillatoriaceae cyanobacterium Prado104]|jgi:hypothetical protein|nr:hypothetical protein [Oscillatoriaceae cyanobacterium Prado104]